MFLMRGLRPRLFLKMREGRRSPTGHSANLEFYPASSVETFLTGCDRRSEKDRTLMLPLVEMIREASVPEIRRRCLFGPSAAHVTIFRCGRQWRFVFER